MRNTIGWLLALSLLLIFSIQSNAQVYSIQLVDVSGCFGGAPCTTQPRLMLKNSQGLTATTFAGNATIQLIKTPSGFEVLYLGTCDINGLCGKSVQKASVPIEKGFAKFQVRRVADCNQQYIAFCYRLPNQYPFELYSLTALSACNLLEIHRI